MKHVRGLHDAALAVTNTALAQLGVASRLQLRAAACCHQDLCTFLDRNSRRIVQVPVNYRCFEIPDRFVVGFGLDHNQLYRNLSYVAVMKTDKTGAQH